MAHAPCTLDNYGYNTHSENVKIITFPRQQLLAERVSLLRYTYIVCLVHLPYSSVSQPPGRGPVSGPVINYTGSREVLLEFVILVF